MEVNIKLMSYKLQLFLESGHLHRHNVCILWGSENPHAIVKNPKLSMWCALFRDCLNGSFVST